MTVSGIMYGKALMNEETKSSEESHILCEMISEMTPQQQLIYDSLDEAWEHHKDDDDDIKRFFYLGASHAVSMIAEAMFGDNTKSTQEAFVNTIKMIKSINKSLEKYVADSMVDKMNSLMFRLQSECAPGMPTNNR